MAKQNRAMDFYRFVAAVMILCFHCNWYAFDQEGTPFCGYFLFVEFFFILSGFLMMRSIRRRVTDEQRLAAGDTAFRYICGRLKSFYPHHLLSFVLVFLIEVGLRRTMYPIEYAEAAWPELLLVNVFGFVRGKYINIICWYLSALVFASLPIYYLILRDEQGFVKVIAPLILVYFFGTLFDRKGSLANTIIFTQYSPPLGYFRGLADLTAGVVAYRVFEWLEDTELPNESLIATVLEAAVAFSAMLYMYNDYGKFDFLLVPMGCAFIISVFRGKSLFTRLFDNSVSEWLGRQCFAFFLNNAVVILFYMAIRPGATIGQMIVFCVPACFLLSVFTGTITGSNKPRSSAEHLKERR